MRVEFEGGDQMLRVNGGRVEVEENVKGLLEGLDETLLKKNKNKVDLRIEQVIAPFLQQGMLRCTYSFCRLLLLDTESGN